MLHIHLDAIRRMHIYALGNLVSSRRGLCNNIWVKLPAQRRKRPDILYFDRLCHNRLLSWYISGRRLSQTILIMWDDALWHWIQIERHFIYKKGYYYSTNPIFCYKYSQLHHWQQSFLYLELSTSHVYILHNITCTFPRMKWK